MRVTCCSVSTRNVGLEEIVVVERRPFGLEELRRYPLFSPEFIECLRRVVPAARHQGLVSSMVVTARRGRSPIPLR
jgi:hypothetical protein